MTVDRGVRLYSIVVSLLIGSTPPQFPHTEDVRKMSTRKLTQKRPKSVKTENFSWYFIILTLNGLLTLNDPRFFMTVNGPLGGLDDPGV